MYPLPEIEKLAEITGTDLLQICIGQNEVILRFDKDVTITILDIFVLRDTNGHETVQEAGPSAAASVAALLGQRVAEIRRSDDILTICFGQGCQLELRGTSDRYESYWVKIGDRLMVV